jgi:hypothetical protein
VKTMTSKISPYPQRPFYTMSEIDSMCTRELQDVDLYPKEPAPIRIDRYIEKRFGVVPSYEELGPGILGLTKFGKGGVIEIVIARALSEKNTVVGERRVRTTFAHEAGHGLLHGHMFGATGQSNLFPEGVGKTPRVLCRDSGEQPRSKANGSPWWEIQANLAIGGFLLPKALVRRALGKFLSASGVFGPEQLDDPIPGLAANHLSEVFDVNPVVAAIRLNALYATGNPQQGTL